jgi:sRNA-binding carbon storage regulator CsrA
MVRITILGANGRQARIGIDAFEVLREELLDDIETGEVM